MLPLLFSLRDGHALNIYHTNGNKSRLTFSHIFISKQSNTAEQSNSSILPFEFKMPMVINESRSLVKCTRRKISPPQLVLIYLPSEPIQNGKNRRKFPSSKDCFVKVAVSNIVESGSTVQGHVPVRYESNSGERSTLEKRKSLINGPTYLLGIGDVTRHPTTDEESKLPDISIHKVCQYLPLNYYPVKDIQPGHYGFWFRFFGKSCKFHILITLKLHKHVPDYVDKVVSIIELDIRNTERCAINRNIPTISSSNKLCDCSLYSEPEYIGIMEKLQQLQEQCLWEKCISAGNEILFGLEKGKSILKACIMLEQSKAVCRLGNFSTAKSLVKQALETITTKSANKELLIARAYMYLSLCHHYDMSLGNAEECLRIASEKLIHFKPCEDTADLHYSEGQLLLSFLLKISNFNKALIVEAKEKLQIAMSQYQISYNSGHRRIMNKIYNAQLNSAILLLLASPGDDSTVIAERIISTLSDCFLSLETKCRFYVLKALVFQQRCSHEAALTNAKHALDFAKTSGLYVEQQLIVKCLKLNC